MNILAVDTAGKTAAVAVLRDDVLLYEAQCNNGLTHSETLLPMIDTALKAAGLTVDDLDVLGVTNGPGSFTGLRIGLAVVKGLAEGLGCTDPVSSPTFAIVNYYRGPRPFAHFDLYRIHTEGDLAAAGFYDYLDMGAVVACEWSENCAELLDLENPLRIHIERVDETTRKITIG